uniref:Uncharacterized protein n=1 Tax=Arundo donax TaxID=35708 RepID=A0A0A9ATF3_ARUDO
MLSDCFPRPLCENPVTMEFQEMKSLSGIRSNTAMAAVMSPHLQYMSMSAL